MTTPASSPSPRAGALARTNRAFASVAKTTTIFATTIGAGSSPALAQAVEGVSAAKHLMQWEPVWGSLLVLACMAITGLFAALVKGNRDHTAAVRERDREHQAELDKREKACADLRSELEAQVATLHEAKFALLREVLTALNNATAATTMHAQVTQDRTVSAQLLSQQVAELISRSSTSRAHFENVATELLSLSRTNSESLTRISYTLKPSNGGV